MEQQIAKVKTYASLLTPSWTGLALYVSLAALTIVLNQFEEIKKYLQLPADLRFFPIVAGWIDDTLTKLFGQSAVQTLVVGAFWAVVGLAVYLFLRGLVRMISELDDDLSVRGYIWPKGTDRTRPLHDLAEQAAFRLVAFFALAWLLFGPLARVLRGPVFADFIGDNKIILFAVWFVASVLLWHIAVVLARLVVVRARIFG